MHKKNKNIDRLISKQLLLAAIFFVATLFIETVTFLLMGFNGVPEYLFLNMSIILIVTGAILIIPSFLAQQIIFAVIIVGQILLSYVNVTLYSMFGTVATLDMINLMGEATRALESSVVNMGLFIIFIIMAIVYIVTNIIFVKKFKSSPGHKKIGKAKFSIVMFACFLAMQFTGFYGYNNQIDRLNSANAYDSALFEADSLRKFGTFAFYFNNVSSTMFSLNQDRNERIESATNYLEQGELSTNGNFTGVSSGNNVITIMAESLEWHAIDEELTPTLHNIKQNHVSVNNYHSKSKTNISEAFGFLGSYPLAQSFSSLLPGTARLTDNNFNYSLPNVLKSQGYEHADYFIFHEKDFYRREETHTKFGFNNIYDISDFDVKDSNIEKWGDWPLDSEVMKGAIDEIAPENLDAPFFNWVTTMSMHGPYEGNYRLQKYIDEINESNWVNPLEETENAYRLKNYMAAAMDLDAAIEYLLTELDQRGLLDTTSIVIYSDHESYYNNLAYNVKEIEVGSYQNPELYRVPFLIYDKNLPAMQVENFASPYDVMPTILDLLGISYNQNMYIGNSLLKQNEVSEVFLSLTGGIHNDEMFTVNGEDVFKKREDITQEEQQAFIDEMDKLIEKILIFNDLYNYDLFN